MAREWCLVTEFVSPWAAEILGGALEREDIDAEVDESETRVWCYADTRARAVALSERLRRIVSELDLAPLLVEGPMLRVWYERYHRYVDPAAPHEDPDTRETWIESELPPDQVWWRVRLQLVSVIDFRRVRRQLPVLLRPVLGDGDRYIDLGARDRADAEETASRATQLAGVESAETAEIRGRVRRWLIRQRLSGNYAEPGGSPDAEPGGYAYSDLGGGDGGDGNGGDGG
jgi:hypothetical protein